jgi:hypothetical protein
MPKIKIMSYEPDYDVIPQAIFWRPLHYFTVKVRDGEDGLDEFKAASFTVGNDIRFDLRTYAGHPEFTVTLYLPDGVDDDAEIQRVINIVVKEMVPKGAVAWRRGQAFEFGSLARPKGDRLREGEARILALKIASQRPHRTISTDDLKKAVPSYTELSEQDLRPSTTRKNEAMWQQIVGNVISHHASKASLFLRGLATRTATGLSVTDKGMDYLNSVGFLSPNALAE